MKSLYPHASPSVVIADAYAYPQHAGVYPGRWVRANMVSSADGAALLNGRVGELTGAADQLVLDTLRGLADVVLVGAGTIRAEGYGPLPPDPAWRALRPGRPDSPPIAVLSGTLDLDLDAPLFTSAPAGSRTILITCAAAPDDRRVAAARHAEVIVAGQAKVDVGRAVDELERRGFERILCEGGPSLLGQLVESDRLDELCLTISPLLAGGDAGRISATGCPTSLAHPLRLAHLLEADGYLFTRYVRER